MRFPGFILCCFLCTTFAVDTTLKYVQVLFRHGEKTPKGTYPTDPHQADTWPEGWKQLTPRGMKQLYDFGKYVRHRYVDTGFLKPNYTVNDIYVLSTYNDRTIMSASSMLAGLYPPSGHQIWNPAIPWQPIPVHPIPKAEDFLLRMKCKTYLKLKDDLYKTDFVKDLIAQYQDLLDIVGKYSGSKMDFEELLDLADTLDIEYSNNLTLPSWLMKDNTYQRILDLKDLRAQLKFYTLDMAITNGGSLLGRMIENMEAVQKPNTVKHKIDFYSGHKTNINAVLSTMRMFNGLQIPMTSAVFVELRMSQTNEWTVDWLFLNDTSRDPYLLTVPGCTPHCELSKLKELTKYLIPADPELNCTGIKPTACPTQGNTGLQITHGSFLTYFFIVLLIYHTMNIRQSLIICV